jgi:hypothetical protein
VNGLDGLSCGTGLEGVFINGQPCASGRSTREGGTADRRDAEDDGYRDKGNCGRRLETSARTVSSPDYARFVRGQRSSGDCRGPRVTNETA